MHVPIIGDRFSRALALAQGYGNGEVNTVLTIVSLTPDGYRFLSLVFEHLRKCES
jgi:hypothetical protein